MLTIPTDFQSAPTTTLDHTVRQLSGGCLVAYRSLKPPKPISALFTRATLIHVRRGTKVMSTHARRGALHVHQDSVVFVPPGLRVMSELLDEGGRYESTVISFDPAFVAHTLPALLHSDPGDSLPPWVLDPTPELRELTKLFSERVQAQASERILELRLQEMAIVLGEAHPETKRMLASALLQSHGRETHRLRHVMEKHAYEPLRLSDYATLCGRSLASFKRDFKRVYNCPPGQWLIEKRLAKAAELLKKGDQRVTDVCLDCGFGHLSHFIRTFREAFGASPKQFQLQAQRGTP